MKKSLWLSLITGGIIITSLACNTSPKETSKAAAPTPPPVETKAAPRNNRDSVATPPAKAQPTNPDMETAMRANKLMRTGVEAIQSGDYPNALKSFQELITIGTNDDSMLATAYYNLACTYALMKNNTPALEYLAKAIKAGYDNREMIEADPDLVSLRELPEYKKALDLIPPITAIAPTADDDAAQKEAMEMIEKVHGLKFKSAPQYKIMAPEMFERAYGGGRDNDSIQGFYRWADKTLYIKQGLDPVRFKGTRIHETFHALQDQLFNISELHKTVKTTDANFALTALIEGDATLIFIECMPESMARMMIASPTPWRMMGGEPVYDNSRNGEAAKRSGSFGYSTAARFVKAIKDARGWDGVNAIYANIPKSTEQVLHPEKYLANEQPVEVSVPDMGAALGAGWDSSRSDTVGEFGLLLGLLSNPKSGPLAEEAALGWAGDKFILAENKDAQKAFTIHQTAWDTAKDAREFFDAMALMMEETGPVKKDGDLSAVPNTTQAGIATAVSDKGEMDYLALNGANVVLVNNLPPELKDRVIKALGK